VGAGAVADQPDTLGIDAELACLGTHILHCRLGVVDRAWIGLHIGLHQPVFDCKHSVAVLGEIRPPVRIEFTVAHLPSTTVDGDQHWRLVDALRRVKVTEQLHAVVLGEHNVVARHHLKVGMSSPTRHQQPRREHRDPKRHVHRKSSTVAPPSGTNIDPDAPPEQVGQGVRAATRKKPYALTAAKASTPQIPRPPTSAGSGSSRSARSLCCRQRRARPPSRGFRGRRCRFAAAPR